MRKFIAFVVFSIMLGCSPSNDSEAIKKSADALYTIDDAKELFQEKYPNVQIDYVGMMDNNFFEIVRVKFATAPSTRAKCG